MENMDNQVQEELEYILPDDYEEEEVEETEEEGEETTETDSEETETQTEDLESNETTEEETVENKLEDLEVKYLHETKTLKDIPRDELKTLVQKGMNHDRVSEKLNIANEKLSQLGDIAKLYNMDEQTLIDTLLDNYFQQTADSEGITKDQAKSKYEQGKKNSQQKMYDRFIEKFPGVEGKDIPQSVWDAVTSGEDLSVAYRDHLSEQSNQTKSDEITQLKNKIESLEKQIKTKEQNETVKKKSPVKSTSKHGNDEFEGDEFLQGLLGD